MNYPKLTAKQLEDRLIDFSVLIVEVSQDIPNTTAGIVLSKQIARSGTSVALNYGEARGGESQKDFIHKMQIVLKELRETFVCLRIIERTNLFRDLINVQRAKKENNELISIFVKSITTIKKKNKSQIVNHKS